ncbi:MAG: glutathione-disulfide reductase [Myxococcales bacterium]|nr:glutathione-disulfide reductase [Myxococcales bacterium]
MAPRKTVDFFVIGGGSGGVRAARIAATHGATVAVAEESRYGGTCVIRGCIPKKFFVYAAEFSHVVQDAKNYGWSFDGSFDWDTLRAGKDERVDQLNSIYIKMLGDAGVEVLDGRATIASANEVRVGETVYEAKHILVATGGRPKKPDISGAEFGITSNEAFHLKTLPGHITIVGAGYIGLEFSGIFRGLGVDVSLVHHRKEALRGFDEDLRHEVTQNLAASGVEMLMETEIVCIEKEDDKTLRYQCQQGDWHTSDAVMFATGRLPNTANMGLHEAGVALGERGEVLIDHYGQSSVPSIWAVGDCTDRLQLTPVAIREGQTLADNLFSAREERTKFEHPVVPTAIFSIPCAATVGLTEAEAREDHTVEIYKTRFRSLFHSLSGREEKVMIKMIVDSPTQRILGLHMVGDHAADIIQAAAIAIGMGATKADFDRTVALHPCTAEELVLMR